MVAVNNKEDIKCLLAHYVNTIGSLKIHPGNPWLVHDASDMIGKLKPQGRSPNGAPNRPRGIKTSP